MRIRSHALAAFVTLAALLVAVSSGRAQDEQAPEGTERTTGDVVAAIEDARRMIPPLQTRTGWTITTVEIVDVTEIVPEEERALVLDTLEERADDVEALRDAIDYSPVQVVDPPSAQDVRLEALLAERGVSIENVVGLETADDSLVIFVWDRIVVTDDAAEL